MLDANKTSDIYEMSKYGKARGFLLAKKYKLPTFSNFFIIQNEEDLSYKNEENVKKIYKNDDKLNILNEIIKSIPLKTLGNIKQELAEKKIYISDNIIKNYLEKIRK